MGARQTVLGWSLHSKDKTYKYKRAWVAQSVRHLTSAQVTISWLVGSSPRLGSVPTTQSLEPASDSVFPSLSLLLPTHARSCSLSLSLSLKNKH